MHSCLVCVQNEEICAKLEELDGLYRITHARIVADVYASDLGSIAGFFVIILLNSSN